MTRVYCNYYKTFHCDHSWMEGFAFHDSDAYMFDRDLFRLFEEAVRRGSNHPAILCKGSYVSGTACDNCERCRDEMRKSADAFELRKIYIKQRKR